MASNKRITEEEPLLFSAQDVANFCRVDLKTIHHWVTRKYLVGEKTKGGHLRFDRLDVVSFFRKQKMPIPAVVRKAPGRVVLAIADKTTLAFAERALIRKFILRDVASVFDALVELRSFRPDAIVVDPSEAPETSRAAFSFLENRERDSRRLRVAFSAKPFAQENVRYISLGNPGQLGSYLEDELAVR